MSSVVKAHGILAVIVLYNMRAEDCPALLSLQHAVQLLPGPFSLDILLYDNTPSVQTGQIPDGLRYIAGNRNSGLSAAYNEAIRVASSLGLPWLLTLDQDTDLPSDFLLRLASALEEIAENDTVAGVVPCVREGDIALSPHWFALDFFRRSFPTGYRGIPETSVYAFNSGATLRIQTLQAIGGYNELFWLDYSDAYLFRQLHLHGYRLFFASDIVLNHQLSLLDAKTRVSDMRFRNILCAGSAFVDMMRGPLVGVSFTLGLAKSWLAHIVLGKSRPHRHMLGTMLCQRLIHRRRWRLQQFREERSRQEN